MASFFSFFAEKRYIVERPIGQGSFGTAYLVKNIEGHTYIIKCIDMSTLSSKDRQNCSNEANVLAKVAHHPFIVKYREAFVEGHHLCIVMEYCSGGDLQKTIRLQRSTNRPFDEQTIIRWTVQITLALKHIHDNRIVHRDLKSANIFIDCDGRLRVADFGLAKALEATHLFAQTNAGTPCFMSPEVCQNEPYKWPADIWALGCTIFEMATCSVPYDALNIVALFNKIVNEEPPQLPRIFSSDLRELCAAMLQKDPMKRPSAQQILDTQIMQRALNSLVTKVELHKKSLTSRSTAKAMRTGGSSTLKSDFSMASSLPSASSIFMSSSRMSSTNDTKSKSKSKSSTSSFSSSSSSSSSRRDQWKMQT